MPLPSSRAEVVICGAGMAGIAAAYLAVRRGVLGVVLVDRGEPLALANSRRTEGVSLESLEASLRRIALADEVPAHVRIYAKTVTAGTGEG
jgi:glycine/D-amino acid oxidase-like deaminating enzyme